MFTKEEHEVCVVSLVPLGGKPKDTVELVFPYTPSHVFLEHLMLAGYTVTLFKEYRLIDVRVKAGAVAKATRKPKKTKATVEEPGETKPSKPQLVESAPKKKRSSRKAETKVVSATDDVDFVPDVEIGDAIVIED